MIDRSMDDRHHVTPIRLIIPSRFSSDLSCDLAWTYRRSGRTFGEQAQHGGTCDVDRHFRFRPDVLRSGFDGGFHPGGGVGRCRLVPSPMAPGCWRTKPDVSACAASPALAPPRIMLMRSRIRRASSKSRALAAASILRWRSSMVSVITTQRAAAALGGIEPLFRSFARTMVQKGRPSRDGPCISSAKTHRPYQASAPT